jgi:hypothetical protein
MCLRGEELDGRLVAWGPADFALGWDAEDLEKAVSYAASVRAESPSSEHAWAGGMAEGELEALSPDGQGILGWGSALLWAASRAESARPGQVLIDDELRTLHEAELGISEAHAFSEPGQGSGFWQLDLEHPWRGGQAPEEVQAPEGSVPQRMVDAITELRRARTQVSARPASVQCQTTLALAMALSSVGRPEEALLEALDALARARELHDPRAIGACMALLAKLYAGVGQSEASALLRDMSRG